MNLRVLSKSEHIVNGCSGHKSRPDFVCYASPLVSTMIWSLLNAGALLSLCMSPASSMHLASPYPASSSPQPKPHSHNTFRLPVYFYDSFRKNDTGYWFANITIGGNQQVTILIDTGSGGLWITSQSNPEFSPNNED